MTKLSIIEDNCLVGKFLIATPNLDKDPFFARKIVYILLHNEEGCMGVVINNIASNITLETVIKLLGVSAESDYARNKFVYIGGPVECECGIVLHTDDYRDNILIETPNSILVSSDSEILKKIASGIGPAKNMFFLGYTGWDVGQVEEEIKNNDWLMLPYSEEFLFNTNKVDLWQKAINSIGITGNYFSKTIGHA